MDVSRETPDVTTKLTCYDLTNILVRSVLVDSNRGFQIPESWPARPKDALQKFAGPRIWIHSSGLSLSKLAVGVQGSHHLGKQH